MKPEVGSDINKYRAITYLESGRQKFNTGRYIEAIEMFEKAIEADPDFLRAYTAKATCLIYLDKISEAMEICNDVIKRDPKYGLAYTAKGVILYKLGKMEEAGDTYKIGIMLEPNEPTTWYNYACFCALTGKEEECKENLEEVLKLNRFYNSIAATDSDLSVYRYREWFEELVAFKKIEN